MFNANIIQLSRFTIGLMWVYQGVFPKLIQIAPLEMQMSGSIGFSEDVTFWFIKAAGVAEIIFGLLFIVFYRVWSVQVTNMLALTGLLIFAAIQTPYVLVEAFNPVTTNIPLLVLSLYLYSEVKKQTSPAASG